MTFDWLQNRVDLFATTDTLYVVEAEFDFGFSHVAVALADSFPNTLWVHLTAEDAGDPIGQGSKLARAANVAFGAPLFGVGMPYAYGVAALMQHAALLAPFVILVTGAEFGTGLAQAVMPLVGHGNRTILQFDQVPSYVDVPKAASYLSSRELRMSLAEVGQLLKLAGLEEAEADAFLAVSEGKFHKLLQMIKLSDSIRELSSASHYVTLHGDSSDRTDYSGLVDLLSIRGKWIEAFEVAVRNAPHKVSEVIAQAGTAYFEQGNYRHFWNICSSLPAEASENPTVAYWRFAAAVATNNHYKVLDEVRSYLSRKPAPELRAHLAISVPGPDLLFEAESAFNEEETPVTTRALGFAYSVTGNPEQGIPYLFKAHDWAIAEENYALAVAAATELAMAFQLLGQYRAAFDWASKALNLYNERDMHEELRRLFIVSEIVFPALLLGRVETVSALVETAILDGVFGIPSLEGLVSTVSDYYIAQGEPERAIFLAQKNLACLPEQLSAFGTLGLVRALVAGGRNDDAMDVAKRPLLTQAGESAIWGELSRGIARLHHGVEDAAHSLAVAQSWFSRHLNAPALAVASIHLARYHSERGKPEEASQALRAGAVALRELSYSGWSLLGGVGESVEETWRLWCHDSPQLEMKFLGQRHVRYEGRLRQMPLRYCELLAALAFSRAITGDRLSAMLYPDGGNMSTLKSILSRLRKEVPIGNKPYRLGVSWQADFVQLQEALREGRVREALELYQGPLLPESEAPFVIELREHLEESLRQAALASSDTDVLLALARKLGDDLELWEAVTQRLSTNDPLLALAKAQVKRIHRSWQA